MDRIFTSVRSTNMKALRTSGMQLGVTTRRLVHGIGYRYGWHAKGLSGKSDMVFSSLTKVVFAHKYFRHQHSDDSCRVTHKPRVNLEYWHPKLACNDGRDEANWACLVEQGWESVHCIGMRSGKTRGHTVSNTNLLAWEMRGERCY